MHRSHREVRQHNRCDVAAEVHETRDYVTDVNNLERNRTFTPGVSHADVKRDVSLDG